MAKLWLLFVLFCVLHNGIEAKRHRQVHLRYRSGSRHRNTETLPEDANETPSFSFIDKVHELSHQMTQTVEVHGSAVVWSPYSVVNVLPLISPVDYDTPELRRGFNETLDFIQTMEGLDIFRVSFGYRMKSPVDETLNMTTMKENFAEYDTDLVMKPTSDITADVEQRLRAAASKFQGVRPHKLHIRYKGATFFNGEGPPPPTTILEDGTDLTSVASNSDLYVTTLGLKADWDTPFHNRYTRRGRFYINETHAVKSRFLNNIGFYKVANLEELNTTAVAVPFRDSPRLYYIIFLPHSASDLPALSTKLGSMKISSVWPRFRTRRVQLSMPYFQTDSQLLFNFKNSSVLQLGSLYVSNTGIEHRFTKPKKPPTVKFARLRRRKEDVLFRANKPFVFYVYDAEMTGGLVYGEVMVPEQQEEIQVLRLPPPSLLSQNGKLASESVRNFADALFQVIRRFLATPNENLLMAPSNLVNLLGPFGVNNEDFLMKLNLPHMWEESLKEIRGPMSEPGANVSIVQSSYFVKSKEVVVNDELKAKYDAFDIGVLDKDDSAVDFVNQYYTNQSRQVSKVLATNYQFEGLIRHRKAVKGRFYVNERDNVNVTYLDFVGRVRYVSVPFWDARAIQVPIGEGKQTLLILFPGERSGLHLIEEGLMQYPLNKILCQMRDINLRVRLPKVNLEYTTDYSRALHLYGLEGFNNTSTEKFNYDGVLEKISVKLDQGPQTDDENSYPEGLHDTSRFGPPSRRKQRSASRTSRARSHSNSSRYRKVYVDRPFLFFIQDVNIGTMVMGRVVKPEMNAVLNPVEDSKPKPQEPTSTLSPSSSVSF